MQLWKVAGASIVSICLFVLLSSVYAYQELHIDVIEGRRIRVIQVVLDGDHYLVSAAALTGGATLEELTQQTPGAVSSFNGAFFCPDDYSYCNGVTNTISERVVQGDGESYSKYWPDTGVRAIFGVQQEGRPLLVQNNLGYVTGSMRNMNADRLEDLFFGIGNRPVILADGEDVVRDSEYWMDGKIRARRTQAFICSDRAGDSIYMGTIAGTTIYEMPRILRTHFQCHNAINLDAGASLAMTYENHVIRRAGRRRIMDAFVVVDRQGWEALGGTAIQTEPYQPSGYQLSDEEKGIVRSIYRKIRISQNRYHESIRPQIVTLINDALYGGLQKDLPDRSKAMLRYLLFLRHTIDMIE